MTSSADQPRIGPLSVAADALRTPGSSLSALLDELGAALSGSLQGAPTEGWRVLRAATGYTSIGAPIDSDVTRWRVANVPTPAGAGPATATIHPEEFPLRPSAAERSRGLELRWPAIAADEAARGLFVVDLVNRGDDTWRPQDGESLFVHGHLRAPDAEPGSLAFGWMSGGTPQIPLAAGEYARLTVAVGHDQFDDRMPGVYELHAGMPELALHTATPLLVDVTAELIERKRRPRSDDDARHREFLRAERERLHRVTEAAGRLVELAGIVASTSSLEDAVAAASKLLGAETDDAYDVLGTPLADFSSERIELGEHRLADLDARA
jgi:hypothetical protein